ncbi:MAG: hypothetical protein DI589_25505 [Shinella sp.]|jgi:hypothetical protein|nr:MAG: hypothetical protein DI589_25505 [Shinella sp.]
MTAALSFDAMRDNVIDNKTFQAACRRLEQGTGSSEAVAMAVLSAVGFPDLYVDALRYRHMRANSTDAAHLDQTMDASMEMQLAKVPE